MAQNTDYSKIFKPETLNLLKGKSGESLRQMLGNQSLMQVLRRTPQLLQEISEAEYEYIDELEMLAEQMLKDAYPIIEYSNIKLDLKIIQNVGELSNSLNDDEREVEANLAPENYKRRIINSVSQGAAVRGAFWFMMFREYLDNINPELVEKYKEIMNLSLGIYNDENAIAMILALLAQNQKMAGGIEEIKYNEEEGCFVIKARALNFAMLMYEGVKGLFEIVGTEGFSQDKEKNKEIVNNVDRLDNEPRDLQLGPHIYDALSGIYNNSQYNDSRIRELIFVEVYKLPDNEFITFVENCINNKLTSQQKRWVETVMREISDDLRADDSDAALNELEINNPNAYRDFTEEYKFNIPNPGDSILKWIIDNGYYIDFIDKTGKNSGNYSIKFWPKNKKSNIKNIYYRLSQIYPDLDYHGIKEKMKLIMVINTRALQKQLNKYWKDKAKASNNIPSRIIVKGKPKELIYNNETTTTT